MGRVWKFITALVEVGVLGLTALFAIAVGVLDYVPGYNITLNNLVRMVLIACGLLMGAVVAQIRQRPEYVDEILASVKSLRVTKVEVLDGRTSFPQKLVASVTRARQFVLDTSLSEGEVTAPSNAQDTYKRILDDRVRRGELAFRRVEVIFTEAALESVIRRLGAHKGQDYQIRHYDAPPEAIPILQVMSFDDEDLFVGGYYTDAPPAIEKVLYVQQSDIAEFIQGYWQTLWQGATPLNDGTGPKRQELQRIASRVGMSDTRFAELWREVEG